MANGNGNGNGKKKPGNKPGNRKGTCTKARADRIIAKVRGGNTQGCAARCEGLCKQTLSVWMDKGERNVAPCYRYFYDGIMLARAEIEAECIQDITDAGKKDWRARAWWLERMGSEEFRLKQDVRLSGNLGHTIKVIKVPHFDQAEDVASGNGNGDGA